VGGFTIESDVEVFSGWKSMSAVQRTDKDSVSRTDVSLLNTSEGMLRSRVKLGAQTLLYCSVSDGSPLSARLWNQR